MSAVHSSAPDLNPTFWRTCRAIANRTRLRILREIILNEGLTVSSVAGILGLSVSHASQALRLLNSRGLLKANRSGPHVVYRFSPNETIPEAIRLSRALRGPLGNRADQVDDVFRVATAFTHPRRIQILSVLSTASEPVPTENFRVETGISLPALSRHLKKLKERGFASSREGRWSLAIIEASLASQMLEIAMHAPHE